MRYMGAYLLTMVLAVMFVMLNVCCEIDVPMSIRFLTMYIVSVLMID